MTVFTEPVWHGPPGEAMELLGIIDMNCTCEINSLGNRISQCPPHSAFHNSQRFLDGMRYGRSIAQQLIVEELKPYEHPEPA